VLEEHPNKKINGVICSTGSLGHGLSFGCGITLGEKINNLKNKNVVLLSDGECNEGSIWEAAGFASSKKLNNLIALIDFNNWQATGRSKEIFGGEMKKKWQAFGWNVMDINGNNTKQIYNALKKAKKSKKKPTAIICNTIKGKGIKFMEDNNNWHYRVPTKNELKVIEKILMQ
jgi:transketolase